MFTKANLTQITTAFAVLTVACLVARPAQAQTAVFNFDSDTVGTTTTFTDTSQGLSATFSSPNDPFIFAVQPTFFQTLSGNILGPGLPGANYVPLDITFSRPVTSLSLDFGLNGPAGATFSLSAFSGGLGGTPIGSAQAAGAVPASGFFPEGAISFQSASPFDTVALTSTAQNLAIDNLQIPAAPEPSSLTAFALGLGMLGLTGLIFKARKRTPGA